MEVWFLFWLQSIENPILTVVFKVVTALGSDTLYILFIAWLYWCVDAKKGEKWVYLVLGSALLNGIVKLSVRGLRPFQAGVGLTAIDASTATGYSFPSGHSQASSVFGNFLALEYKEKWIKVTGLSIFLIIGFSRLYLRVHWPIDVLVGWTLGACVALMFHFLYEKYTLWVKALVWGFLLVSVLWFRDPDQIKLFGLFIAVVLGMGINNHINPLPIHGFGKGGKRKYIIGIFVVMATMVGLKALLPETLNMLRYFVVGFTLSYLYPWLFSKCYRKP